MLGSDVHPALPSYWGVERHWLNHLKTNISLEAIIHCLLPVQGHCGRLVNCVRRDRGVNMQF